MKIAARGTVDPNYFAFGRCWPKHDQIEVEVTPDEYERIKKDSRIVCIVIPEAPVIDIQHKQTASAKGK